MSGISRFVSHVFDARVASGDNSSRPKYTPEHEKNGKTIGARIEFSAFINRKGYVRDGVNYEGRKDVLRFVAWGGLATMLAKSLAMGQEFSCDCEVHTYTVQRRDAADNVIHGNNGSALLDTRVSFQIKPGTFHFGAESPKTVAQEITDGKRPQHWNVLGHPDNAAWKESIATKRSATYQGGDRFFYADVVAPKGAQQVAYKYQATGTQGTTQTNVPAPNIDGITYEMLIANKWTDTQIAASKYATLLPSNPVSVPNPPATGAVGV